MQVTYPRGSQKLAEMGKKIIDLLELLCSKSSISQTQKFLIKVKWVWTLREGTCEKEVQECAQGCPTDPFSDSEV